MPGWGQSRGEESGNLRRGGLGGGCGSRSCGAELSPAGPPRAGGCAPTRCRCSQGLGPRPRPWTHLRERRDASDVSKVTSGQSAAPMIMQCPDGLPAGGARDKGRGAGTCSPSRRIPAPEGTRGKAFCRYSPGPVSQDTGNWRSGTFSASPDSWTHQNGRSPNSHLVGQKPPGSGRGPSRQWGPDPPLPWLFRGVAVWPVRPCRSGAGGTPRPRAPPAQQPPRPPAEPAAALPLR